MSLLEEANRRLHELQAASRQRRIAAGLPTLIDQGQPPTAVPETAVPTLPGHLGWESDAVTQAIRARERQSPPQPKAVNLDWQPAPPLPTSPPLNVRILPDVALAILRADLAAPGRAWYLLKHADQDGRGWTTLDEARQLLTGESSPWRICGRRQLRNLLTRGEGIFWERENGRLWLRSAAKVAAALGVERIGGHPVAVPARHLLGSLADARAHLYASFYSGRARPDMPIARDTLAAISGVDKRSQRAYEARTKTAVQHNFCIGERAAGAAAEEQAWQRRGQGAFVLTDSRGEQGAPGRKYLAWQLPNTYSGQHHRLPRGSVRRVNRELQRLLIKRAAGNGNTQQDRHYHANGRAAAMAHRRNGREAYWRRRNGRKAQWHVLGDY